MARLCFAAMAVVALLGKERMKPHFGNAGAVHDLVQRVRDIQHTSHLSRSGEMRCLIHRELG